MQCVVVCSCLKNEFKCLTWTIIASIIDDELYIIYKGNV